MDLKNSSNNITFIVDYGTSTVSPIYSCSYDKKIKFRHIGADLRDNLTNRRFLSSLYITCYCGSFRNKNRIKSWYRRISHS